MANPVELLPLLILALVLLAAGGADVSTIEIAVDGDRTVTDVDDVLIVGGGTAAVPADERVDGPIYVIGGDVLIAGDIDGDVVQLAGNLTVADGARIAGELRLIAGRQTVAEGATVPRRTDITSAVPVERSPLEQAGYVIAQTVVLALAGVLIARRRPALLRNVGDSITEHGVVSVTVGLLAGATGIALVVFMALTVILLPVSLLGLVFGFLVVAYAYVVYGHLVGTRLPIERSDLATVTGVAVFVVAMELVGRIPLVGPTVQLALLLAGIGAVLITYFGLREFEPVELPE